MSGISSPPASATTSRRRKRRVRLNGRTSQGSVERRLSKVAAALNQAWQKAGTPGVKLTAVDLARIYLRDDGKCVYCEIELDPMTCSFDHSIALSKGGPNTVENLVLCCITDQRTKHAKTPAQHASYQQLERICPVDGTAFRPRFADVQRGLGFFCSRRCSATTSHR